MPFPKLHPALTKALQARDYAEPTPVQDAVLAADPARDLLVSAQTGSGKTVAYGLSLAAALLGAAPVLASPDAPLALVVAPTRELAMQVHRELEWLFAEAGGKVVSCVGGMDARREQRALAAGCHIVVGTPGRLRDHLERGRLNAAALKAVVLDEADEMLDLGFREDLEFILAATPSERRTLLFSATIPKAIALLARNFQRDSLRIDVASATAAHADIEYRAVRCAPQEGEHAVVNVLRYFEARAAIVFCATRDGVRHMHASLTERGFAAVALSGELSQNERSHGLQALRDGRARVCVATDVAARGLDLPDLSLVIHADLPNNRETLLHRSGRTGRAGRKGVCVLIVPVTRRRRAETLLMSARVACTWSGPPTADEVRAKDEARLLADPVFTGAALEEDVDIARALQARHTPDAIALALASFLRQRLPAPEDLDDPGAGRPEGPREVRPGRAGYDPLRERPGHATLDGAVWFRLNIGRAKDADPKWLIPLLCRAGRISKAEIGAIKIADRETMFEIAASHADTFTKATARMADKSMRIERAGSGPHGAPSRDRHAPRGARPASPAGGKPDGAPPRAAKAYISKAQRLGHLAGAAPVENKIKPGKKERARRRAALAETGE
ncbi:MAG: DEAD/DEAH box helicase [Hyphomicrobiales bacterium]|nr:DEAD/DEAH box helicase [Hyphomicrobiales bacterium]